MMDVLKEPAIQKVVSNHGLVMNLFFSKDILQNAFRKAADYAKKICLQRSLNEELKNTKGSDMPKLLGKKVKSAVDEATADKLTTSIFELLLHYQIFQVSLMQVMSKKIGKELLIKNFRLILPIKLFHSLIS